MSRCASEGEQRQGRRVTQTLSLLERQGRLRIPALRPPRQALPAEEWHWGRTRGTARADRQRAFHLGARRART
eukprot:2260536-Pyramimonas_sp.AAC.1